MYYLYPCMITVFCIISTSSFYFNKTSLDYDLVLCFYFFVVLSTHSKLLVAFHTLLSLLLHVVLLHITLLHLFPYTVFLTVKHLYLLTTLSNFAYPLLTRPSQRALLFCLCITLFITLGLCSLSLPFSVTPSSLSVGSSLPWSL